MKQKVSLSHLLAIFSKFFEVNILFFLLLIFDLIYEYIKVTCYFNGNINILTQERNLLLKYACCTITYTIDELHAARNIMNI